MEGNEPLKYIEKIVLEIVERSRFWFFQWRDRRKKKFNIARFNTREAAYAFLRQYDGESFVKAQKITVQYNNQELHLCVRDLIYGEIHGNSNTAVEFICRKAVYSEITWPIIRISRDPKLGSEIPEIHFNGDYSSINVDESATGGIRIMPCNTLNDHDQSSLANSTKSFCRDCQVRQSISGLQKLIRDDGGNLTLGHDPNNENRFQTSIYIRVNQIKKS